MSGRTIRIEPRDGGDCGSKDPSVCVDAGQRAFLFAREESSRSVCHVSSLKNAGAATIPRGKGSWCVRKRALFMKAIEQIDVPTGGFSSSETSSILDDVIDDSNLQNLRRSSNQLKEFERSCARIVEPFGCADDGSLES
ncbi:hypothetical protein [Bradyrhizobium sp. USDA 4506]